MEGLTTYADGLSNKPELTPSIVKRSVEFFFDPVQAGELSPRLARMQVPNGSIWLQGCESKQTRGFLNGDE